MSNNSSFKNSKFILKWYTFSTIPPNILRLSKKVMKAIQLNCNNNILARCFPVMCSRKPNYFRNSKFSYFSVNLGQSEYAGFSRRSGKSTYPNICLEMPTISSFLTSKSCSGYLLQLSQTDTFISLEVIKE